MATDESSNGYIDDSVDEIPFINIFWIIGHNCEVLASQSTKIPEAMNFPY